MQYQLRRGSLGERTHQDLILLIPTVDPTVVKSAKKEPVKSAKKEPAPPESGSEAAGLAAPTARTFELFGHPSLLFCARTVSGQNVSDLRSVKER